jgi:hypothetical protein
VQAKNVSNDLLCFNPAKNSDEFRVPFEIELAHFTRNCVECQEDKTTSKFISLRAIFFEMNLAMRMPHVKKLCLSSHQNDHAPIKQIDSIS